LKSNGGGKGLGWISMGKADSALVELNLINGIDNLFMKGIEVEGLYGGINRLKRK
jgi:hypothetical protein